MATKEGVCQLHLRRLVQESDGIYKPVPEEVDVLAYYANAIAHWRHASAEADDSLHQKQALGGIDVA